MAVRPSRMGPLAWCAGLFIGRWRPDSASGFSVLILVAPAVYGASSKAKDELPDHDRSNDDRDEPDDGGGVERNSAE